MWIQHFSVKELALKLKTLKLKTKFMMTLDDNNACISFTVLVYSYQKRRVK